MLNNHQPSLFGRFFAVRNLLKNDRMKLLNCLIAAMLSTLTFAQIKISGTVVNQANNQPVEFADIYIDELGIETSANSDGTFYIEHDGTATQIEVAMFGFESKTITLNKKVVYDLVIQLQPESTNTSNVELEQIVVSNKRIKYKNKKENPAWAILKKLWERKKSNGLRGVPNYEYEEYEKIEFDINNVDSAFMNSKIFKDFEFVFEKLDTSKITGKAFLPAFINESIYKVNGRNTPNKKERKDLIANKASGFDDNEIVSQTAKNLYKEYNIYQNRINFFNKNFVSPIARDGFAVYDYILTDTLDIDGVECFKIKYYPKQKDQLTFKGEVYISNHTYAVKEISMQATKGINVNFVRDVYVELEFNVLNDSVFLPKRTYTLIDLSLLSKKNKSKGMFAHRTVSYKDYNFNQPKEDAFYAEKYDPMLEGAYEKNIEFWKNNRHEALSKNENGIYETLDQLSKVPRYKKLYKTVETLGSGYYQLGNIDIGNLYQTFGFNDIEGIRLRLGARTYYSKNDMWRIAAYTAYGFRDQKFKYGAEARIMFNKYNRFQIGLGTKRDVEQLGAQLTISNGILSRSFASSTLLNNGANNLLSNLNTTNFYASIEPWENFVVRTDANYKTIKSADASVFNVDYIKDGIIQSNLIDFTASTSLIYRPKAKYSRYGIDRYEHSSLTPTLMLRFTKGFESVFNSEFNYDKLQFYYQQPILIGSYGRSNITFEAGKTFDPLPLSLLSVIPGNESFGQAPGTFNQLDFYEFVTDTYSTLIIDHHFNGWLLSKIPIIKKSKLRSVAFFRGAWGEISDQAVAINRSNITYQAPNNDIYYEYGFGIENIGFGNIRPIRVNFNWRGNYKQVPDARLFGVTVGMNFTF